MSTITTGVFRTKQTAESAINKLKENGIATSDISCVYTDQDGDIKDSQTGEKVGAGAAKGAATGAAVGAIAGLVVANGILPGIGTLFVAGPIATALGLTGAAATTVAGAATGAAAGGLIGGLKELGVANEDAEMYENYVKKGNVLVITKTDTTDMNVVNIFEDFDAMEVRQYPK